MSFPIIDVYEHPHYGDSVRYENYVELQEEIESLRARVARMEAALQKIADGRGMIPDKSTIYMSGKVPEVPKHFNMYDMREIARRALEEK